MHIADDQNRGLPFGSPVGRARDGVGRLRAERYDRPFSQAGSVPGGQSRGVAGDAEHAAGAAHDTPLDIAQATEELRADLPYIEWRMIGKLGKHGLIHQCVHRSIEFPLPA